ncbi:hypothetical protein VEZ01S_07_00730 [Vibrio ezurae NBRC 102218]|uniref:Uncharacterized protein n=1 Tax=Vibrio ezurae NBRC 102218 TaxID=1219080 RepID=U3AG60_9VIBR|nr:hypothetical protein VEZ01S_07_00730 [Vibrio ezurae NBRC 102218]
MPSTSAKKAKLKKITTIALTKPLLQINRLSSLCLKWYESITLMATYTEIAHKNKRLESYKSTCLSGSNKRLKLNKAIIANTIELKAYRFFNNPINENHAYK